MSHNGTNWAGAAVDIAFIVALVILAWLGFPKETILLVLGSLVGARVARLKSGTDSRGPGNGSGSALIALIAGMATLLNFRERL